jgi:hypothetical protein
MTRGLIVLLLAGGVAVAAPVPKALKRQPTLDGRWEAVLMHSGQQDILAGNTTVWDISGEKLTRSFKQPDGTLRSNLTLTITFPDKSKPDELDYGSGPNEVLFRARITLTADELTIRFADQNAPRPADMTEGTDGYYYQFKRVEK